MPVCQEQVGYKMLQDVLILGARWCLRIRKNFPWSMTEWQEANIWATRTNRTEEMGHCLWSQASCYISNWNVFLLQWKIRKPPNKGSFNWFWVNCCWIVHTNSYNIYMGVSKNDGIPKSSILIGFSIIFTIRFGVPLFLETPTSTFKFLALGLMLMEQVKMMASLLWSLTCRQS